MAILLHLLGWFLYCIYIWFACALCESGIEGEQSLETEGVDLFTYIYLHDFIRLCFMVCIVLMIWENGLHLFSKRTKPEATIRVLSRRPRVRKRVQLHYVNLRNSYRCNSIVPLIPRTGCLDIHAVYRVSTGVWIFHTYVESAVPAVGKCLDIT